MGKGQGVPPPTAQIPVPGGLQRTALAPQPSLMQYHILAIGCELEVLPEVRISFPVILISLHIFL